MATITTRAGKGSPLTNTEVDNNFTNLNTAKYESGNNVSFGTITATGKTTSSTGFEAHYVDSPHGAIYDHFVYLGKTDNATNHGNTAPVYQTDGSYGVLIQANSDGVFFGLEEEDSGHYNPVIKWGDDHNQGEDLYFRHADNTYVAKMTHNSFTVEGTITATGGNSGNWNTAYGWGNHASAGYLASTSYTASDVLTKIKTVDGANSGLDADTVDGLHSSSFVQKTFKTGCSNAGAGWYRVANSQASNGRGSFEIRFYTNGGTNAPGMTLITGVKGYGEAKPKFISVEHCGDSRRATKVRGVHATDGKGYIEVYLDAARTNLHIEVSNQGNGGFVAPTSTTLVAASATNTAVSDEIDILQDRSNFVGEIAREGHKVWDAGNDGSGSTLDADTVDGIQGSSFLRSDADDTTTGHLTFSDSGYSIGNEYHTWKRQYAVKTGEPDELLYHDGNSLPNGGAYRFHAHIDGTGTDQSATAVYWNQNGTWKLNVTYQSGASSNHPEFIIHNSKPHISIDHTSNYTVQVLGERMELSESTGTDNKSGFGADAYLSVNNTTLRYNPSGAGPIDSGDLIWHAGNDGSGSGLDADKLDGIEGSAFLRSNESDTMSGNLTLQGNLLMSGSATTTNQDRMIDFTGFDKEGTTDFTDRAYIKHTKNTGGHGGSVLVISSQNDATDGIAFATHGSSNLKHNSNTVWTAGNDGSGSGLDADTLDGQNGSYYLGARGTNQNYVASSTSTSNRGNYGAGVWAYSGYSGGSNRPFTYDATLQVMPDSGRGFEIATDWVSQSTTPMKVRSLRDCCQGWSEWTTVWTSGHDGSGSGLDADTVDGIHGANFLRSDADDSFSGALTSTARDKGIFGNYDSSKTDQIWSIGTSYKNASNGSNFGNLYGAAYKHTNNSTGGTMAGGHQFVWCQNGTPNSALGTNIWTTGNVTAYSDIRVKTNIERIPDALDKVSQLNGYTFDRTDVAEDEEPLRQTGVIAQEVLEVLPEAVTGDEEGHYSVAYGNMVGLLIEAVKELKAEIEELKGGK